MDQKNENNCARINLTANSSDLRTYTDADCASSAAYVWKKISTVDHENGIKVDFQKVPFPGYSYLPTKYAPKRIIFNKPATVVFWKDGTKTVVKCAKGEKWNEYNAFCAALAIKVFGSNSRVQKIVRSGEDQTKKGRHEK